MRVERRLLADAQACADAAMDWDGVYGAEEGRGFFGVGGAEVDDDTGCQGGVLSLFPAVVAVVRVVAWRTKLVHVENGGQFGRWP